MARSAAQKLLNKKHCIFKRINISQPNKIMKSIAMMIARFSWFSAIVHKYTSQQMSFTLGLCSKAHTNINAKKQISKGKS